MLTLSTPAGVTFVRYGDFFGGAPESGDRCSVCRRVAPTAATVRRTPLPRGRFRREVVGLCSRCAVDLEAAGTLTRGFIRIEAGRWYFVAGMGPMLAMNTITDADVALTLWQPPSFYNYWASPLEVVGPVTREALATFEKDASARNIDVGWVSDARAMIQGQARCPAHDQPATVYGRFHESPLGRPQLLCEECPTLTVGNGWGVGISSPQAARVPR